MLYTRRCLVEIIFSSLCAGAFSLLAGFSAAWAGADLKAAIKIHELIETEVRQNGAATGYCHVIQKHPVVFLEQLAPVIAEVSAQMGMSPSDCSLLRPYLLDGGLGCAAFPNVIREYYRSCVHPQDLKKTQLVAARREYYKMLFDKEMQLMRRLIPADIYNDRWLAFKNKWDKRMKADPEVMNFDYSPNLSAEERGMLNVRMNDILKEHDSALDRGAMARKQLGIDNVAGFFAFTSAAYLKVLESSYAHAAALRFANTNKTVLEQKDKQVAAGMADQLGKQSLENVRNALYSAYPEFDADTLLSLPVDQWMRDSGASPIDFSKKIFANTNADFPQTVDAAFGEMADLLSKRIATDKGYRDFLGRYENIFLGDMDRHVALLDNEFADFQAKPERYLKDPVIVAAALAAQAETEEPMEAQKLQAHECVTLENQAYWQAVDHKVQAVGSVLSIASLATLGTGTVASLFVKGGMKLGMNGMRMLMLSRASAVALRVGGISANIVGAPMTALSLYDNTLKFNKAKNAYYRQVNADQTQKSEKAYDMSKSMVYFLMNFAIFL